jgi:hypothetical protein
VVLERTTREPPHTRVHVEGTLHLTPHHLIFHPTSAASTSAASASVNTSANPDAGSISASDASGTSAPEAEAATEVWVPYPTINVLQRLTQAPSGRYPLLVGTKTFDTYTLLFERDREGGAEDVWQSIKGCAVARK